MAETVELPNHWYIILQNMTRFISLEKTKESGMVIQTARTKDPLINTLMGRQRNGLPRRQGNPKRLASKASMEDLHEVIMSGIREGWQIKNNCQHWVKRVVARLRQG